MMPLDRAVIRVSFDALQIGSNLVWHVADTEERNLMKRTGRHAGSVLLQPNDEVLVEVFGFGPLGVYGSSEVLDAVLITVPHTSEKTYSAPSPWSADSAAQVLGGWTKTETVDDPAFNLRTSIQGTQKPLVVGALSGRWEMSLVVTVRIDFISPVPFSAVRVFSFDPESEVGTGADPNLTARG